MPLGKPRSPLVCHHRPPVLAAGSTLPAPPHSTTELVLHTPCNWNILQTPVTRPTTGYHRVGRGLCRAKVAHTVVQKLWVISACPMFHKSIQTVSRLHGPVHLRRAIVGTGHRGQDGIPEKSVVHQRNVARPPTRASVEEACPVVSLACHTWLSVLATPEAMVCAFFGSKPNVTGPCSLAQT
jgi:hypothetical protein